MKKLRLDLEALSVEKFSTTADRPAERGTVRGHTALVSCLRTRNDPTCEEYCFPKTREDEYTCGFACESNVCTG